MWRSWVPGFGDKPPDVGGEDMIAGPPMEGLQPKVSSSRNRSRFFKANDSSVSGEAPTAPQPESQGNNAEDEDVWASLQEAAGRMRASELAAEAKPFVPQVRNNRVNTVSPSSIGINECTDSFEGCHEPATEDDELLGEDSTDFLYSDAADGHFRDVTVAAGFDPTHGYADPNAPGNSDDSTFHGTPDLNPARRHNSRFFDDMEIRDQDFLLEDDQPDPTMLRAVDVPEPAELPRWEQNLPLPRPANIQVSKSQNKTSNYHLNQSVSLN